MKGPTLTIEEDNTDDIMKTINSFKNDMVLVGIPEESGEREEDAPINNAGLLFLNEFGSPGQNIPARPALQTGIKLAQEPIAEEFKNALKSALTKGSSALGQYYNRIGTIASNSVKKVINDQINMEPPAESTIKSRKSKGFKGTKALIVTGQMRNAITYVVKE